MRRGWQAWMLGVALAASGAGCGESGEPLAEFFSLTGTLTSTSRDASGRNAYVQLFGAAPEPAAQADTRFVGARADYVMRVVPAGSYTLQAFVDFDGDTVPSAGDLVARARSVSLYANLRLDIGDDAWGLMP